jgi:hypothetical protein
MLHFFPLFSSLTHPFHSMNSTSVSMLKFGPVSVVLYLLKESAVQGGTGEVHVVNQWCMWSASGACGQPVVQVVSQWCRWSASGACCRTLIKIGHRGRGMLLKLQRKVPGGAHVIVLIKVLICQILLTVLLKSSFPLGDI